MNTNPIRIHPRKTRSVWKEAARCWQLYLFLALPLAYLLIFNYAPMVGAQIAFRKYTVRNGLWGSPWVGLYQFRKFFSSFYFERVVVNTLRLSLYSIVVGYPLPIVLALMFNAMRCAPLRKFSQNILYMPHFISVVVMVGMLYQFFNTRMGLFVPLYRLFVREGNVPNLLTSATAFPHLYTWSGIWQGVGWGTVIYTAALSNVDQSLHEAAVIDGASRVKRIWYVDIPAIVPTITITLILRFGAIMGIGFDKAYLMQSSMNLRTSEVIATYVYKVGLETSGMDFSYSTAIGLFNSVIGLIMLALVNFIAGRLSDTSLW